MSTHKHIDRICVIAIVCVLLITTLFMNAEAFGVTQAVKTMGYENRLFDTSRVHTIDIVMDDWDGFIDTAQSEEYSECTVIIDGESYKNVGIRGKGNTSLSTVSSMDSDRYSFKIEFDQYDSNKSYYGLDKLSLNNVIQDNTYMKDYLTYRMMNEFGVSAPLCSYAYVTVNGEDWGLYLAVEAVEDAFLQRNYGNNYGELYKPDSMGFGGGRGNGRDFNMEDFADKFAERENSSATDKTNATNTTDTTQAKEEFPKRGNSMSGGIPQLPEGVEIPEDFDFSQIANGDFKTPDKGGFGGGMGSNDVKLNYTDDNHDSYSNIFDNAKTDITDSDKDRLISSLKQLGEYENLESVVDIEKVIRYFVVHNFVCNGDSYTGSMIHNYYLYEEDGRLSMIPWDYNLAFGTFQGGNSTGQVNSPIDTPVSGDMSDRPMIGWIFSNDEYTELYHQYFSEFLASVDITGIIDQAAELIAPYVEKDPTKFCTYEDFEKGVSTLRSFCELRAESVSGQLDGTIPSTTDGQNADNSVLVDASSITLSDMGTMNMGGANKGGFGGMDKGNIGNKGQKNKSETSTETTENMSPASNVKPMTNSMSHSGEMPQGSFGGMTPPEGFNGERPNFGDMEIPTDENGNPVMPDNFGGGMPNTETPDTSERPSNNTQSGNSSEKTEQIPSNQNSGNAPQNPFGENGNSQNSVTAYILLAVSAVILGGGLLFALKFRR